MQDLTDQTGDDGGRTIEIGCHVEVDLIDRAGSIEAFEFDLAPEDQGDFDAGFVAANASLGRALIGARAGQVLDYRAGDVVQVRIRRVSESARTPPTDADAARQAAIASAIKKSDLLDAVRFSLTVDQKWGDTDPQVMADNWE